MASRSDLDEFGAEFAAKARDLTIRMLEVLVEGRHGSDGDVRIAQDLARMEESDRELALHLIRRFIDSTLHNVLWMIEESKRFDLVAHAPEGRLTSLTELSDGLTSEPYTEAGWYARFSKYGEADFD